MKALLLGATGVSGKRPAALLAGEKQINKIGIASRRLDAAQNAAAEIGDRVSFRRKLTLNSAHS